MKRLLIGFSLPVCILLLVGYGQLDAQTQSENSCSTSFLVSQFSGIVSPQSVEEPTIVISGDRYTYYQLDPTIVENEKEEDDDDKSVSIKHHSNGSPGYLAGVVVVNHPLTLLTGRVSHSNQSIQLHLDESYLRFRVFRI